MAGKAIFFVVAAVAFPDAGADFPARLFDELTPWMAIRAYVKICRCRISWVPLVAGVMLFYQFRKFKARPLRGEARFLGADGFAFV